MLIWSSAPLHKDIINHYRWRFEFNSIIFVQGMLKILLSHSGEVFCFKNLLTLSVAETRHGGGLILIQPTHEDS